MTTFVLVAVRCLRSEPETDAINVFLRYMITSFIILRGNGLHLSSKVMRPRCLLIHLKGENNK